MTDKRTVFSILSLVLALGVLGPLSLEASNAIAKKEAEVCTTCHDKPGSKLLTSEGKYYELTRSLADYDGFVAKFGPCTSCHVRKPGSAKLKKEGKVPQDLGKGMDAVKIWVLEQHPSETKTELTEDRGEEPAAEKAKTDSSKPRD